MYFRLMKLFGLSVVVAGLVGTLMVGLYVSLLLSELPSHDHLKKYAPPVMSRVHSGSGALLAEYAHERRLFVPIENIPKLVVDAFLAAEDNNFRTHPGVNFISLARAMARNVFHYFEGRRLEGASTITQQVAKNFLLSSDITVKRKLKEAILAFKLERAFEKDALLELYLNEIYLGSGHYGVAAAMLNYFNKPLVDITIAEAAYLAALPKAPNNYHPIRHKERAKARRNWVIERMRANGFIDDMQAESATKTELLVINRDVGVQIFEAEHFAEEVRRRAFALYGEKTLYSGGLSIRSTLDKHYQKIALRVLRKGLAAFDRKHGYHGAVRRLAAIDKWWAQLENISANSAADDNLAPWRRAVVLDVSKNKAQIGILDTPPGIAASKSLKANAAPSSLIQRGEIALNETKWARAQQEDDVAPPIESMADVLTIGDVVWVERHATLRHRYLLRQVPEVNGALVALDPHTGRILAMVGGFDFRASEFNRATQAKRQPGSAFKSFIYAKALDSNYTPASRLLDTAFVKPQGDDLKLWKPKNYDGRFHGLSTLRLGIEKSRNLMTLRLAEELGMGAVIDYARKFDVFANKNVAADSSVALGSSETTLLKLTTAYAMFVNGGRQIKPVLIDRVQDRYGRTIYRNDNRECAACVVESWENQPLPVLADIRETILSPQTAYQIVSMLEGAVLRGSGRRAGKTHKPLAGKTGTTSDNRDAWFVGFSPDLAVGVYVGYDDNRILGAKATGGTVAAPIFGEFMREILANKPATPFRTPANLSLVRINAATGRPALPGDKSVIVEAFKIGTEPKLEDESMALPERVSETSQSLGLGGLY